MVKKKEPAPIELRMVGTPRGPRELVGHSPEYYQPNASAVKTETRHPTQEDAFQGLPSDPAHNTVLWYVPRQTAFPLSDKGMEVGSGWVQFPWDDELMRKHATHFLILRQPDWKRTYYVPTESDLSPTEPMHVWVRNKPDEDWESGYVLVAVTAAKTFLVIDEDDYRSLFVDGELEYTNLTAFRFCCARL